MWSERLGWFDYIWCICQLIEIIRFQKYLGQRKQSPESDSPVLGDRGDCTERTSPSPIWVTDVLCSHHKCLLHIPSLIFISWGFTVCPFHSSVSSGLWAPWYQACVLYTVFLNPGQSRCSMSILEGRKEDRKEERKWGREEGREEEEKVYI